MTKRFASYFLTALAFSFLFPAAVLSQSTHWVQIEAHATLRTAEDFANRYESEIGGVAGFRLSGGWYALAVGPFDTPEEAESTRQALLARRVIRSDAYVTDERIYGQQFWPAGGMAQLAPMTVAPSQPEPAPEVTMTPDPAPDAEPEIVATPEPEPEIEELPEETLAEARANENRLTRDERAEIQVALQWFGHYTQAIDAAFGPGTRGAIREWQEQQGFEGTGFLTTRQRAGLLGNYDEALARYSFESWRDDRAGIEITLPMGMLAFDRHESPFVHFSEVNDSGMRLLLISQEGTQATLFGLYEIMQTLEVIPLDGQRERRNNSFLITGESATARAHVVARFQGGEIKGYALLWDPQADDDAELVLSTLEASFRPVAGVLESSAGASASTVSRRDLLAGLDVRRPVRSRSGFFVDAVGTVVTSAEAVESCGRVTIDEAYQADVRLIDTENGIAVLAPRDPLVPLAYAQFAAADPRLDSDVRVSGFSYQDTLVRPILTFGQMSDTKGLNGEDSLRLLSIRVQPGDSGGPVFDGNGAVMGMLLPRVEQSDRILPEDVNFAVSGAAIIAALDEAGLRGALSRDNASMPAEILTRVSADLTVLVSCWN
ncbi:MAG: trypsin-like peptidase domain-containing protein [Pararhodobacter sp.]|nr:trypsin-like peptidase domain-containing protein [Pararhodobacter sp.]